MEYNPVSPLTAGGESVSSAFGLGLFVVMWNYLGWDGLSTVAGEMKNPKRDYPKTLLISMPLITACYLLPTLVGLAVVGSTQVEWTAGAWTEIAEIIGGRWLGLFLAGAALVSAAGLFSALLLSVSRVPFVMGEDGYLPRSLLKVHPKYGTPWVALVVSERDLLDLHPRAVPEPRRRRRHDLRGRARARVRRADRPADQGAGHGAPVQDPGRLARRHPRRGPAAGDHRLRGVLAGEGRGLREGGRLGRGRARHRSAALLLLPLAQAEARRGPTTTSRRRWTSMLAESTREPDKHPHTRPTATPTTGTSRSRSPRSTATSRASSCRSTGPPAPSAGSPTRSWSRAITNAEIVDRSSRSTRR